MSISHKACALITLDNQVNPKKCKKKMTHFEKQNTNSQIINLFKSNKAISEIQNKIKKK